MSDRKAVIKNADMGEEMQQDAVDCATQALEKYNIEKVIGKKNAWDVFFSVKSIHDSSLLLMVALFVSFRDNPIHKTVSRKKSFLFFFCKNQ